MRKNDIKALGYVVTGIITTILSTLAIAKMWLSTTFIPVYVGKNYILGRQLLRYFLYGVLFVIAIASLYLVSYGAEFLIKRLQRRLRRR